MEIITETVSTTNPASAAERHAEGVRGSGGFTRLISVTGVLMSLALPIGVVPRIMQSQELDKAQTKVERQAPTVYVANPSTAPDLRTLRLPGTIQAIVEAPIYARSNGYVRQRFADIGDRVKANQLLAEIETPEIDQSEKEAKAQVVTSEATRAQSEANRDRAKADLARAIADLAEAEATVAERKSYENLAQSTNLRWKKLVAEGAISAQDGDEKETAYQTSQSSIKAAREHVESAKSAIVAARARLRAEEANIKVSDANLEAGIARAKRATSEKSFQKVTSPFAGVITERNIEQGNLISSGSDNSRTPMYKLASIDTVRVYVDVPQYASPSVRVGQAVKVVLREFPGKEFIGKVARTAVALDPNARTLKVEIHVPNQNLTLAPGMYADVNFAIPRTSKMYLIPANALISRADGPQVITIQNGNTAHYKQVTLGEDLGKQIEVVAGLNGSDKIVVNAPDSLGEGARVAIGK